MPDNDIKTIIPAKVAHHVLWTFGRADDETGYRPGDFTEALLAAFGKADAENQMRLAEGFPEYGAAYFLAAYQPGGIDRLKAIARASSA